MNIILFEASEVEAPLPLGDERAEHILKVLRMKVGDSFDVGCIDRCRGKAVLAAIEPDSLTLEFKWGAADPELAPIDLIVGLSRPQTNRKILQEATTLGARRIFFVTTSRGEPSYAQSKLWTSGEWRRHVVSGVAQAFATRLPQVRFGLSLADAIEQCCSSETKLALDNYEATETAAEAMQGASAISLAIGSERGWVGPERQLFCESGYTLASLGERPLRTETACVASISLALAALA